MSKPRSAFHQPMATNPVDGEVAITGPEHVHGSFTPEAARASADRLNRDADQAEQQQAQQDEAEAADDQESQTGSSAR